MQQVAMEQRVVMITGAARRVGAGIARALHARGARLVLHYRDSQAEAQQLAAELNAVRPDSAVPLQADLLDEAGLAAVAARAVAAFGLSWMASSITRPVFSHAGGADRRRLAGFDGQQPQGAVVPEPGLGPGLAR
ncbi:SDR family NAD(P)-dependent oxidoreductase [Paludibacterium denitrificans]|uniref:SDR family NAD(P)-dependent oxidoreductase n=1 Tax=Paludibacterium denitrificans TaxID=2675226 RepID=UPI002477F688|nr:SDR family NAD(P)-dependent oxidoreductase [Paludibacterium denitrificans]